MAAGILKRILLWLIRKVHYFTEVSVRSFFILQRESAFSRMALLGAYLKLQFKKVFLIWLLHRGIRHEAVLGFRMRFDQYWIFDLLFREIFIDQDYFFKTDKTSPFIVDCGSNFGMSIIFFKKLFPDARIAGFEPSKAIFNVLEQNVKDNDLEGVVLYNKAVSDKPGKLDFFYDDNQLGSFYGMQSGKPVQSAETVEAVTLSSYINEEVDFLKIDIEGAEEAVLLEMAESGKLGLVKQMVIEYHHHLDVDKDRFSCILSLLENQGFGYQIKTGDNTLTTGRQFQDILIGCYRKRAVL